MTAYFRLSGVFVVQKDLWSFGYAFFLNLLELYWVFIKILGLHLVGNEDSTKYQGEG